MPACPLSTYLRKWWTEFDENYLDRQFTGQRRSVIDPDHNDRCVWGFSDLFGCMRSTKCASSSKNVHRKNRAVTKKRHYDWPAAQGPVCIPTRSLRVSSGRWRMVKCDTWSRRLRAMLQISKMCLPAFGSGNPLTTMYASPMVSTWRHIVRHVSKRLSSQSLFVL